MSRNVLTHERTVIPSKVLSDPYMRMDVEQVDHHYTQYYILKGWSRSQSCVTGIWNESSYVGINPKSSAPSVNLTKKITILKEGWYRIRVKARRGPNCYKKKVGLYINDELEDVPMDCYYGNYHWKMHDYGLVYLNTGSNIFKLTVDKPIIVSEIILHKVNIHSSANKTNYAQQLDVQKLNFTQNSINELNTFSADVQLKEEYFEEDSPSRFIFDGYINAITLYMGDKAQKATQIFGGYIYGLSDTESVLTIKGADRLLDFYREPLLLNFEINTKVRSDTSKVFPYVHKNNIYETIRYIAENNEIGINCSGLESPYIFYWDFSSQKEFNYLPVKGYTKKWDKRAGNPKPCLRLGVGKIPGLATATLFNSPENPFDANINNIFAFGYMFSSKSAKYPTEMHIQVDMFKEGETANDALTYNILFNSKEGSNNVIGSIKPTFNGKWNVAKINLRNAFDNYVPSSEYNVTAMRFADTVSYSQVKNRLHSAIWLDNISVYDESKNVKANIDAEGSYPFEFFQKICNEGEYSLWVDPASDRRNDVLILKSDYEEISEVYALPQNTIKIGNVSYDMRESNVRNNVRRMYHPTIKQQKQVAHIVKNKPSKKKYKRIWVTENGKKVQKYKYYTYKTQTKKLNFTTDEELQSSYKRYLGLSDFKNLTDTTKLVDAEADATKFLNEHNTAPIGFTITLKGTTLLHPNEYIYVENDRRRLTGLHKIKTISHEYNIKNSGDKWQVQIDCGKASNRFRKMGVNMRRAINRLNSKDERTLYGKEKLLNGVTTSPGAFI